MPLFIIISGRSNPRQGHGSKVAPSSPAGEQTMFKWSIDGFSSLLDKGAGWTYSRVFEAMGQNWYGYLNNCSFLNSFVASQFLWLEHLQILSALYWFVFRCLKLNPKDKKSGDDKEYVSLRLELANSSVRPDTVVNASFKLLIYDQSFGNHSEHEGIIANLIILVRLSATTCNL